MPPLAGASRADLAVPPARRRCSHVEWRRQQTKGGDGAAGEGPKRSPLVSHVPAIRVRRDPELLLICAGLCWPTPMSPPATAMPSHPCRGGPHRGAARSGGTGRPHAGRHRVLLEESSQMIEVERGVRIRVRTEHRR
jgi:hypothetical protein